MSKLIVAVILLAVVVPAGTLRADECEQIVSSLKLPRKLKLEGKPKQARWAHVEKTLTTVREAVGEKPCRLTFGQVFTTEREGVFFPLLYNLLLTAPEESLAGASIYGASGLRLGTFSNRVPFSRRGESNYSFYYFQFLDAGGELQSGGRPAFVDTATQRPLFLLSWDELKERVLVGGAP